MTNHTLSPEVKAKAKYIHTLDYLRLSYRFTSYLEVQKH